MTEWLALINYPICLITRKNTSPKVEKSALNIKHYFNLKTLWIYCNTASNIKYSNIICWISIYFKSVATFAIFCNPSGCERIFHNLGCPEISCTSIDQAHHSPFYYHPQGRSITNIFLIWSNKHTNLETGLWFHLCVL